LLTVLLLLGLLTVLLLLLIAGAEGLLAVLALGRLALHGGHTVTTTWRHTVSTTWRHLWWLSTTTTFDDIVSLHVTAHPVVTYLLLELDKLIIQSSVELVSLHKHGGELVLSNDSIVELVVERSLGGGLLVSSDQSLQGLALLADNLRNVTSLRLEFLVFLEVLVVFYNKRVENGFLVSVVLGNLHELLNSAEGLVHSDTFGHHGILLLTDLVKLVKSVLDGHHDGVGADIGTTSGLGDLSDNISARLADNAEHSLVCCVSLEDLLVNLLGLLHLLLVVVNVLAVGSVNTC